MKKLRENCAGAWRMEMIRTGLNLYAVNTRKKSSGDERLYLSLVHVVWVVAHSVACAVLVANSLYPGREIVDVARKQSDVAVSSSD